MCGRVTRATDTAASMDAWLSQFAQWTPAERARAMDSLLQRCTRSDLTHLRRRIHNAFCRDIVGELPHELALRIFLLLDVRSLCRASQVCRRWRSLCGDNMLWREVIIRNIGMCTSFSTDDAARLPDQHTGIRWKDMAQVSERIERNLCARNIRTVRHRCHGDRVITGLLFHEGYIVTTSDDNMLSVWARPSFRHLYELRGHQGGVWAHACTNKYLISGSTDRTVRIWDLTDGSCVSIIDSTNNGHTSTVRCLCAEGDYAVSGSRDQTLRGWHVPSGRWLHTLSGHTKPVRCIQLSGNTIVSGSYDGTLRVWDRVTARCLHVLEGHTNKIYSLNLAGRLVASGSLDNTARVWDIVSGACLGVYTGHTGLVGIVQLHGDLLVTGSSDCTIKVWHTPTTKCLHTLNEHYAPISSLQACGRRLVSGSDDGTVKVWNVYTGKYEGNILFTRSPTINENHMPVWRIWCVRSLHARRPRPVPVTLTPAPV